MYRFLFLMFLISCDKDPGDSAWDTSAGATSTTDGDPADTDTDGSDDAADTDGDDSGGDTADGGDGGAETTGDDSGGDTADGGDGGSETTGGDSGGEDGGSDDTGSIVDCALIAPDECDAFESCASINGAPYDDDCVTTLSPIAVGCMSSDIGCAEAITHAAGPDGKCMWFGSLCIPDGWTECDPLEACEGDCASLDVDECAEVDGCDTISGWRPILHDGELCIDLGEAPIAAGCSDVDAGWPSLAVVSWAMPADGTDADCMYFSSARVPDGWVDCPTPPDFCPPGGGTTDGIGDGGSVDPPPTGGGTDGGSGSTSGSGDGSGTTPGGTSTDGVLPIGDITTCTGSDFVTLEALRVDGDELVLDISHSGGCGEHRYSMCWNGTFGTGIMPEAPMKFSHNTPGDPCEAMITKTLRFSLEDPIDAIGGGMFSIEVRTAWDTLSVVYGGGGVSAGGGTSGSGDDSEISGGDEIRECAELSAADCSGAAECTTLAGRPVDVSSGCRETLSPERVGCMDAGTMCGMAMTWAAGSDGRCMEFTSTCVPAGWTRCDPAAACESTEEDLLWSDTIVIDEEEE